ncbi:uncharacterized protein LOC108458798 [Gossypium arboreum]|uniref:uncharacterized protein LOC108458798 n=1 Tax=Gossypium arboreum TaxID=29729 RepID=UPI00081959D6|nr:uncharacterized protein LOC108458798 [Gossypium arboreum]
MVADALSHRAVFTHLSLFDDGRLLAELQVKLTWIDQIRVKQMRDESLGQQVKDEHQLTSGLLHPVMIPLWKWEHVMMDFISRLPLTPTKDSIWVIVDQLTKSAHFIPVQIDYSLQKLSMLYISEIVRLHEVPVLIISDRDTRFTSWFWKKLHEALDLKRRNIKYSVGDFAFLKVSPWKKVLRFGLKDELSSRFIGPYQILKRVGPVVYQLGLPLELSRIHDVFHVSMLRRYWSDPSHVVSVEEIKVLWQNHSIEEATWEPEDSMRQQYPYLF